MDIPNLPTDAPGVVASPVVSAPSPTSTPQVVAPVINNSGTEKKRNTPLIIGAIIAVLIFVGMSAFIAMKIFGPGQVKEKLAVGHPVYKNYNKSITAISDYLLNDSSSGFDSDSLERMSLKEKTLLKSAEDGKKTLSTLLESQKNVSQLSKYNLLVDKYIKESELLIALQKDSLALSDGFIRPVRQYEKLTTDISGASQYLYSNPAKYVTSLKDAIVSEDEIISQIKSVKVNEPDMQDTLNLFVDQYTDEKEFLQTMVTAVEGRNSDLITSATKKYSQQTQDLQKDVRRVTDKLDENIKAKKDTLDEISSDIDDEYSELKSNYKF